MATYRVPQQHTHQPGGAGAGAAEGDAVHWHDPASVTATQHGNAATQRNSLSSTNAATQPTAPPYNAAAAAPGSSTEMAPLAAGAGAAGAGAAGGVAAATQKPALPVRLPNQPKQFSGGPTAASQKQTYVQRHPEEAEKGWSRGRKICCCLTVLFAAILITVGVLIAFMVRVPTVSYKSSQILCADNNYLQCAQETIQIRVWLEVDNPNILGATINADLGLYKQDGTFLGPGTIDDTAIGKRTTTEVTALFNITSNRGYDIVTAIFIPPTRSVDLTVRGTVYVHVGLLRPSVQVQETFTVPPQDIMGLAGGIIDGLGGLPTTGDAIEVAGDAAADAAADAAPDVVDAGLGAIPEDAGNSAVGAIPGLGGLSGLIPSIPGVGDNRDTGDSGSSAGSDGAAAAANTHPTSPPPKPKPQQAGASVTTALSRSKQQHPQLLRVNPTLFAQALLAVGAPNSPARQSFLLRQSQAPRSRHAAGRHQAETLAQRVAKSMHTHMHLRLSVAEQLRRL